MPVSTRRTSTPTGGPRPPCPRPGPSCRRSGKNWPRRRPRRRCGAWTRRWFGTTPAARGWGDYLRAVKEAAGESVRAPTASAFLDVLALEQTLDFAAVADERRRLFERLVPVLTPAENDGLIARAADHRAGALSHGEFYDFVADLCRRKGIDPRARGRLRRVPSVHSPRPCHRRGSPLRRTAPVGGRGLRTGGAGPPRRRLGAARPPDHALRKTHRLRPDPARLARASIGRRGTGPERRRLGDVHGVLPTRRRAGRRHGALPGDIRSRGFRRAGGPGHRRLPRGRRARGPGARRHLSD
jgi:hypothetical protein